MGMEYLENRTAFVTRHLARRLLSVSPGERIPTTSDIAGELGVGFGTVEKAFVALRDGKVIKTRARGQMGTFLLERDLPRQWTVAGLGAAVGLLPIPNSMLFVGLATGITKWLETTGIPFMLNFKNGGRSRVAALVDGRADFAMVSGRTAELVCAEYDVLCAAFSLPERTYYAGHHIISRPDLDKPRQDWVIGVDPTSYDHISFCEALFPGSVKREVRYVNLPYAVMKGEIDATSVHSRSLLPLEVASQLQINPAEHWDGSSPNASATVVLCRKDNAPLRAVLAEAQDPVLIHHVQQAVMNGEHEPEY